MDGEYTNHTLPSRIAVQNETYAMVALDLYCLHAVFNEVSFLNHSTVVSLARRRYVEE